MSHNAAAHMAPDQYRGRPHQSPQAHNTVPLFGMGSPPGLSLTMQGTTNNSNMAHGINMIPGLAFGSPPAPSVSGFRPHQQSTTASPDLQRTRPHIADNSSKISPVSLRPSRPEQVPANTNDCPELSEGEFEEEFEDLYEPRDAMESTSAPLSGGTVPSHLQQHGSEGDADDSSIYDNNTPQVDVIESSTRRASIADEDWEPSLAEADQPSPYSPRLGSVSQQRVLNTGSVSAATTTGVTAPKPDSPRQIAEAKKKAQEAILALWPLKVRYQNYIDEGFDEAVVKALFKELGLDTTTTKRSQLVNRDKSVLPTAAKIAKDSRPTKKQHSETAETADTGSAMENKLVEETSKDNTKAPSSVPKSAAEERKDKIARKLAAKSQKPAVVPKQVISEAPKALGPSPAKPKSRAETNALLHQKLAALKKSQEKAAADKLAAKSREPAAPPAPSALTLGTQASVAESSPSTPAALPETDPSLSRQASEPIQASQHKALRSAATTPLMKSTGAARASKRPVASDFDNYATQHHESLKRSRTQDTLIIDVSDDDDVEMDMGSPVDDSTGSFDHAGQSIQAAATHSDSRAAELEEKLQSDSIPVTPVPEGNGKLHLLRGKIEEMRRKIAEAEAKKSIKTPVDTDSSRPHSPVSQDVPATTHTNKLPKLSELKKDGRQQSLRRDNRVVSVELLLVESDLKSKQDQLKEILAQAAKLELDIQSAMTQKYQLTSEMEDLAQMPDAETKSPRAEAEQTEISKKPGDAQQQASRDSNMPSHLTETTQNSEMPSEYVVDDANHVVPQHDVAYDLQPSQLLDSAVSVPKAMSQSSEKSSTSVLISPQVDDQGIEEDGDVSMSEDEGEQSESDVSMRGSDAEDSVAEQTSSAASSSENDASEQSGPAETHRVYTDPQNELGNEETASTSSKAPDNDSPQAGLCEADDTSRRQALSNPGLDSAAKDDVARQAQTVPRQGEQIPLTASQAFQSSAAPEDVSTYHSPLGYFRAYRFHPRFFEEVPGGLKSLTYSSNINVEQMLCPIELEGQDCSNPSCEYQHFQKMVLPDGDIITQIGSAEMFSGDTKTQFIAGLRKILHELKVNKVKDFDRITKAIVQYRADFLADKSKVLPLDGVTL